MAFQGSSPVSIQEKTGPDWFTGLDKNTSGILVMAKNEYALNRLSKQFFERTTDRRYNALVWGIPDPPEGTITGNVGRSIRDRKIMQVFKDGRREKQQ